MGNKGMVIVHKPSGHMFADSFATNSAEAYFRFMQIAGNGKYLELVAKAMEKDGYVLKDTSLKELGR
jgi:hypothetical protein